MTGEDLARQWDRIRSRLAEEVRPPALRSALSNPWVVGALAAGAALGLGYVFGRRAAMQGDEPASEPASEQPPGAGISLTPLYRKALEIGIDALAASLRTPGGK